jgi:hypothetical protein
MKKGLIGLALLSLSIIGFSQQSLARSYGGYSGGGDGWTAFLSGIYYFTSTTTGSPGVTTTQTRTVLTPAVGYHFNTFFFGATYDYDTLSTATTNQPTTTNSFRSYGAMAGVMTDNVYLTVTYFFSTIGTLNAGAVPASQTVDVSNGSGYQAELGYMFNLGGNFYLGPAINYKSLSYSNYGTLSQTYTFASFTPRIVLKYNF